MTDSIIEAAQKDESNMHSVNIDEEIKENLASKEELLREYRKKQDALTQRNKASMEVNAKEAETKRLYDQEQQKAKDEARQFKRDAKRGEREKLEAERRQKHKTAQALEIVLQQTCRQYEEALASRNVVRGTVAQKERLATEAKIVAEAAFKATNQAHIQYMEAKEKALFTRKAVQEAKSPSLDANITAIKTKLQDEFTQVHDAWDHFSKKRRKELQNNELRKQVRDLL